MQLEQPRMPDPPTHRPPAGACDAHSHVFGPYDRFPLALPSSYPPPDSPYARHERMRATLGIDRAVLIQPAPYASDNSALVDALERGAGHLRGVAVVCTDVADDTLESLHAAGVRAIRFLEMRIPGTDKRYPGSIGIDALPALQPRMAELGWHAEIWGSVEQCADVAETLSDLEFPVVLDHLAGVNLETDRESSAFERILDRVRAGDIWVKLSLCRFSVAVADYDSARPFHDALIEANPRRVVWGTDFPYVRRGKHSPDGGRLLDLLHDWTHDADVERQILADNPALLYDFD